MENWYNRNTFKKIFFLNNIFFSHSAEHSNKVLDFTWYLQDHMLISTEQGNPSTKRIILRVCGWYLHFRLVFPGSDRIITLGIKDFERKCTLHRQNYVYICMGPTGPGHSLYISMSKCVLTSIHQNEGEKKTQWKVHKLSEDLQVCSFCENVRKDFCIERKTLWKYGTKGIVNDLISFSHKYWWR